MLTVRQLSKSYSGRVVGLHPTDLTLAAGERVALLGPSGSGKSTLLRLIQGLEAADSGEVWVNGTRVDGLPPHRRGVALLPQRAALYPDLTVKQNLEVAGQALTPQPPLPRKPSAPRTGGEGEQDRPTFFTPLPSPEAARGRGAGGEGLLDILRLAPLLSRYPHELSGGEKQRVALAKLLGLNRPVWLLDEPFSGLDPMFRSEFRHDLLLLAASACATILLVTHDPIDALALGQRIGVLADGRIRQLGPADELRSRPGHRFVAFCIGDFSLLDGTVEPAGGVGGGDPVFVAEGGSVRVPVPPSLFSGRTGVALGLRPDDLAQRSPGLPTDSSAGGITGWPLVSAEPDGSGWLLTVARGRTRVRVRWRSGSPPPVGALTDWTIPAGRGTWFDGATGDRL